MLCYVVNYFIKWKLGVSEGNKDNYILNSKVLDYLNMVMYKILKLLFVKVEIWLL